MDSAPLLLLPPELFELMLVTVLLTDSSDAVDVVSSWAARCCARFAGSKEAARMQLLGTLTTHRLW